MPAEVVRHCDGVSGVISNLVRLVFHLTFTFFGCCQKDALAAAPGIYINDESPEAA